MKTKRYHCWHCDAEYQIRWELNEDYYEALYCAFCAESIDDDDYRTDEDE